MEGLAGEGGGGVFPEGLGTSGSLCRGRPLRTGAPNSSHKVSGTGTVTSSHLLVTHLLSSSSACLYMESLKAGQPRDREGMGSPVHSRDLGEKNQRHRPGGGSDAEDRPAGRHQRLRKKRETGRRGSRGPSTRTVPSALLHTGPAPARMLVLPSLYCPCSSPSTGTSSRATSSRMSPLIRSRHFIPLSQVGGFHAAWFCAG